MKKALLETLEKSKNYTLQTAEAMPEERYDFKPTDEVWSFKELMNHVAYCIQWMDENYLKDQEADWAPPTPINKKSDIIGFINKVYADAAGSISKLEKVDESRINGVYAIIDHTTHHRGQAVTYLRCNNIAPPEYVF